MEVLKFKEFLFENKLDIIRNVDISNIDNKNIEGRFLTKHESKLLQKEIESYHTSDILDKRDIRRFAFNFDNPYLEQDINGVNLRVAQGLIRDGRATYLLYADKQIIGEFYSISEIKAVIKYISTNLIKSIH